MPDVGLYIPQESADPQRLRDAAQAAEDLGFHSLWADDRLRGFPWPQNRCVLEATALLGVLSGWTDRIRLGALAWCSGHRPPALLAKTMATLDVLSGGRVELGLRAGCDGVEPAERGSGDAAAASPEAALEEALEVVRALWGGAPAPLRGGHGHLIDAFGEPRPAQSPGPPVTVAGGEEVLETVARLADGWNQIAVPLVEYERLRDRLRQQCERLGRSPDGVRRSLTVPMVTADWEKEVRDQLESARRRGLFWAGRDDLVQGTPDIVVPRLRDYARRGVSLFVLLLPDCADLKRLEFIARSIVAELD